MNIGKLKNERTNERINLKDDHAYYCLIQFYRRLFSTLTYSKSHTHLVTFLYSHSHNYIFTYTYSHTHTHMHILLLHLFLRHLSKDSLWHLYLFTEVLNKTRTCFWSVVTRALGNPCCRGIVRKAERGSFIKYPFYSVVQFFQLQYHLSCKSWFPIL